jgi:hypothetical protein
MSTGGNIGKEAGASATQLFQAVFLVGGEGAELLCIGVHPDSEAFQGGGGELDLVMAFGSRQEREEGAGHWSSGAEARPV